LCTTASTGPDDDAGGGPADDAPVRSRYVPTPATITAAATPVAISCRVVGNPGAAVAW
jgi:hypothetical protein